MSRNKGKAENSGKKYEDFEYNLIFILSIRGISEFQIARVVGRTPEEVNKIKWRLCNNATDYPDKKQYDLYPPNTNPFPHLNGWSKLFLKSQLFDVKEKRTIKELNEITGIPDFIIENFSKDYQLRNGRQEGGNLLV